MVRKPKLVKPTEPRLNLTLDEEVWVLLDAWRAKQPDVPTRLHAVRRILDGELRPARGRKR